MDMPKLEPCPFCSGEAKLRSRITNTYPAFSEYWCYCTQCYSSGKSFDDLQKDGSSLFKAIEAWNTRIK